MSLTALISVDMEGIAGVCDWDDTDPGGPDYEQARRLMTAEASAAVRGVLEFDTDAEVLVADAHASLRNILPDELDPRARLLRGTPRQNLMLPGVERGVEVVVFIGYHGQAGRWRSVLAHTMNGNLIFDVRCQGRSLGELGLNVAQAAAHGVTPVLAAGDDTLAIEAADVAPGMHVVEVKRSLGGWAVDSLHPEAACRKLERAVPAALEQRGQVRPLRFEGAVELEVDLVRPGMVEPLLLVPGIERTGDRTVRYRAEDYPAAYRILELVATFNPRLGSDR